MYIAVLINHNTAAKFYGEILKKLGHIVYIPLYCSIEEKTLQYNDVLTIRNIEKCDYVDILDKFDFYGQNKDVKHIYDILNSKFDIIMTLHAINDVLNKLFLNSEKKIYYIVWGNETNDPLIGYRNKYDEIIKKNNLYFSIGNRYIYKLIGINNKYKYMPLGLFNIEQYENIYYPNNNDILIIISRLQIFKNIYFFIKQIAKSLPMYTIHVCGKFNEDAIFVEENIHKITFESNHELYQYIKKCKLNINMSLLNVLQYSPYECACIGIPTLYQKNSALDTMLMDYDLQNKAILIDSEIDNILLNKEYIFRYDNIDDLIEKINLYMDMDIEKLKLISKKYNEQIYNDKKIDKLVDYWQKALE